ncbi:7-cyano-7-deazaguanine synthase QueC [Amycolatopsis sp. NPDC059021]|uniref:7-cyano-7-deazaguanine synthase QueC n=1 Tax=Amycolatopsis sp. NPDC059021 TaxID=3346704 RepID=UPI0036718DE7
MDNLLDLLTTQDPPTHVVSVVSGGLDSTTMAFALHALGARLTLVSFDYQQRHRKELAAARAIATRLDADHEVIDLGQLGALLSGCALTDASVEVPEGHYTDASMRSTVVPNRNAIMLDIATGIAIARGADAIAFGAHGGDYAVYPDCRPAFVDAYATMVATANAGFLPTNFRVLAPFLLMSKAEIVRQGSWLGVPFELTWSCYNGQEVHCGLCGTCVERRLAFELADLPDPTTYADPDAPATQDACAVGNGGELDVTR